LDPRKRPNRCFDAKSSTVFHISEKPLPLLRLFAATLLFAAVALSGAAQAQSPAQPPAPPSSSPDLSPAEAQQALSVLQDDAKRASLIETLRAIAKAAPAAAAATPPAAAPTPAPTAAPAPATAPAPSLVEGSLGAELLLQASSQIEEFSHEIAQDATSVTNLPLIWRWLVHASQDPASQQRLIDFVWRFAVVLACALAVEWIARFALRRPYALLKTRASRLDPEPIDPEATVRTRRLMRLRRILARIPFALTRLILEVAPPIAFAVAGNLLLATQLGEEPAARLAILALVNAYVACRVVMGALRALVSRDAPRASLFVVTDEAATAIEIWTRRTVLWTVFGLALANAALALGLWHRAYHALIRLVILGAHLLLVVATLRCRRVVAHFIRAPVDQRGFVAVMRNRLAAVWHYLAIVANLALWAIWALRIQNGYALLGRYALTALAVFVIARAITVGALGGMDKVFRLGPDVVTRFPGLEARANRYYPALRGLVSALILAVSVITLLQLWGVDAIAWFESGKIGASLVSALSTIAVAVIVALAIWESCNAAMDRHLARLARESHYMRAARLRTLLPMLRTTLMLTILTVVGLTALSAVGVNIAPLLAGAGIVGIAIGFGSQKLVQDVITGLFLLLENAMQVGDFVTVSGLSGNVENLSIRTIRLRAGDGSVHIIPFSSVTSVTNTNRGIGNASVSVSIAYEEDTDRASEILKEIAAEIRKDRHFAGMMRGDLALWGVDKVDGAMVTLVGQIECTDSGRWPVQREFNRRMKIRFQELGVQIAIPSQSTLVAPETWPKRERDQERPTPVRANAK
jgi:moderate conductance mechanosensitive channel